MIDDRDLEVAGLEPTHCPTAEQAHRLILMDYGHISLDGHIKHVAQNYMPPALHQEVDNAAS